MHKSHSISLRNRDDGARHDITSSTEVKHHRSLGRL
jgi:hypothetical protein